MARNSYKVPQKVWSRWSKGRQAVFNRVFGELKHQTWGHPKADVMPAAHWKTIAWNASWIAGEHAEDVATGT